MKKCFIIIFSLFSLVSTAQDHFAGINTSKRVGILNVTLNPAELSNLSHKREINFLAFSVNASNNVLRVMDIYSNRKNLEELLISTDHVNANVGITTLGPSFAIRIGKWGFGVSTNVEAQLNLVNLNSNFANVAFHNNDLVSSITINTGKNQRITTTAWGEVGFSVSRVLFEDIYQTFSVGGTLKLIIPTEYTNISMDQMNATLALLDGDVQLTEASMNINITHSGGFANTGTRFINFNDLNYSKVNGLGGDIGATYILKKEDDEINYKLKGGMSIKNMGSMLFESKSNNAISQNLYFSVPDLSFFDFRNSFNNAKTIYDILTVLENSGFASDSNPSNRFRVNLPTGLSLYTDYEIVNKVNITIYGFKGLNSNYKTNNIVTQDLISLTPRFSTHLGSSCDCTITPPKPNFNFEVYSPWSLNKVSGLVGGIGLRLGGFFIGSSSAITAFLGRGKEVDFNFGFRTGF